MSCKLLHYIMLLIHIGLQYRVRLLSSTTNDLLLCLIYNNSITIGLIIFSFIETIRLTNRKRLQFTRTQLTESTTHLISFGPRYISLYRTKNISFYRDY